MQPDRWKIRLIGYCIVKPEAFLERFVREGPGGLTDLQGEYTAVLERPGESCIITSYFGACQYYYAVVDGQLYHDDTVIGVLRKSRLPWTWNWRALADFAQLDFTLENETLHPRILRVPPRSVLRLHQGMVSLSSQDLQTWYPQQPARPEDAVEAFNAATRRWLTADPVVSMSAGFDSRVILSSVLKMGGRPLLFSVGSEDSTDVQISRQIAAALGLPFLLATLDPADYLEQGDVIARLTNGTKRAWHWHTYLYPRKARIDPGAPFLVGTNGEFARTFYFDKGVVASLANLMSTSALQVFWKRKLETSLFTRAELGGLAPEFSQELSEAGIRSRIERLTGLCHRRFLRGLDRFYLEQRVSNFMGNGVKLYQESVAWRSPFLDRDWIAAAWNLPRRWKYGSNWHRFAIAANCRHLLEFPEVGRASRMAAAAPPFYWLQLRRRRYPAVPFAPYPAWFRSDMILDRLRESREIMADVVEPGTLAGILDEAGQRGTRTSALAFLLALCFWQRNLTQARNG